MLENIKSLVAKNAKTVNLNGQPYISLFISLSNGKQRASAHHVKAQTFAEAWSQLEDYWSNWVEVHGQSASWLRVDWTQSVRKTSLKQLKLWFEKVKRNYFRYGLVIGDAGQYAFTEQELNANAMLYGGVKFPHVVVNENNFSIYAKKKYKNFDFEFSDTDDIWMLDNTGVFISEKEGPFLLHPKGRDAGRRIINKLDTNDVFDLIESSSQYLAGQVQETGEFHYGWHPCFDREINFYNTLRHASTTYSMIEAYEINQSVELKVAIDRSLSYLIHHFIKLKKINNNENKVELTAAFLVEYKEKEIKLGANGVLILALCKYTEVFSDNKYLELLEQLALGISFMQDNETGKFKHVLNYPDFSVKDEFRIIYYDGEAAFGLMRLYGITKDERWLAIVEKAFDYFIAADHWKAHDHWLSYCVNELTLYKPDEKYYRFGIQNVAGYLDFVATRITTFPTLLELMMAAERMVCRLQKSQEYAHLLDDLDLGAFYEALEKRAHYLLNGYFWPEIAMYFANPERIVGSFFIRHHSFRVRIDDVEHYLSGFVAYWKYLESKKTDLLSSKGLKEATGGEWVIEPTKDWKATGICIHLSIFKAGHVLIARGKRHNSYLSDAVIKQLIEKKASAIICVDPTPYLDFGVPVLQVRDVRAATLALGKEARNRFTGKVVGITGSAGKTTTVAMMAHALSQFGIAGATQKSANLPIGIAWNQVNMPKNAIYWVVEMAIGNMAINTELVMPQVAIITNIAPAHLVYHKDTQTIAEKKSLIMDAMPSNGTLILFGEILHKDIFLFKAKEKNIKVITYGESKQNDIQLLEVINSTVKVRFWDDLYEFDIGLVNKHMILNALSVFASLSALKLDWKANLEVYQKFQSLEGRGEITEIDFNGRLITVYDESYNANPISMKAAIESMSSIKKPKNKFLILGDMMELGSDEVIYHKELKKEILKSKPDKLILCGSLMKSLWDDVKFNDSFSSIKKKWYPSVDEVISNIDNWLENKDHIMLKASNSIGFDKVIEYIKN